MKARAQRRSQALTIADMERMAQVLKLLAHPYRLKIIELLAAKKTMPVHSLVEQLALPQALVSRHLQRMQRAGLLKRERRGQEVWYSIGDRRSLTILSCMRNQKGTHR